MECVCTLCERKYIWVRASGHTQKKCNSCLVNKRRFQLKLRMIEYKGGCCQGCGYKRCPQALGFHHLDPSKKDFNISGKHCLSWKRIRTELDKCVLLCQNCHAEVHAGVRIV